MNSIKGQSYEEDLKFEATNGDEDASSLPNPPATKENY